MALPFLDEDGADDGDAQADRHGVPERGGDRCGASSHWVAVPPDAAEESVREFGVMTDDLRALADWLMACKVEIVALESTGVYWIPLFEILEQRGLQVWLVDARQMKYVPGRKSDVQDCQWLQRLMSYGLLRAAWRPAGEVCELRAIARLRETLLAEQASWVQRMQKALVQMNIQLTEVLTDVMGMSGQAIIRDIVAGERNPEVLARHRHRRVKASTEEVIRALTGNWRQEHLFVLGQALSMYDDIARHLRANATPRCWVLLGQRAQCAINVGAVPERQQGARCLRCPADARQLGRGRSDADQRARGELGDEDPDRDRTRPLPLCQREALLLVAGAVPRDQGQRWQGALGRYQAFGQPRAPGPEDGRDDAIAQQLRPRSVLSAPLQPDGQTQGEHRNGA